MFEKVQSEGQNMSTVKWKNEGMRCECEWDKGNEEMW
jgi:hypothetical protein